MKAHHHTGSEPYLLKLTKLFRPCLEVKFFLNFTTVALSFVCDKILFNYRLTRIKRFVSSFTSKLCNLSFYFRLYLMLHACVTKFDVTENLKK